MLKFTKILLPLIFLIVQVYASGIEYNVYRQTEKSDFASELTDQQIKDINVDLLKLDLTSVEYSLVETRVFDGYYVTSVYSASTYESFLYRIDKAHDGAYRVIENYEGGDGLEGYCGVCPSDTAVVLLTACFSRENHISRRKVKEAVDFLRSNGVRGVVHLAGQQEATPKAVLNWLACKGLRMWGRIGHGNTNVIDFKGSRGGTIMAKEFAKIDLEKKLFIINSCKVHHPDFIPHVIDADKGNGYFFCGGDRVNLMMNESEYAFYDIVTIGITQPDTEFGALVKKSSDKHCQKGKEYGSTRNAAANGSCTWAAVSSKKVTVTAPVGGEVLTQGDDLKITWESNFEEKVKIELLLEDKVVKEIPNTSTTTKEVVWKIEKDVDDAIAYKIKISSSENDSVSGITDSAFTINTAPEFTSEPVEEAQEYIEYEYEIEVKDKGDPENIEFTLLDGAPKWLDLKDNKDGTALLSGKPEKGSSGEYEITIDVTDGIIIEPVKQAFTLEVKKLKKPDILIPPEDMTVDEGDDADFFVDVEGELLKYQWYKDGKKIKGETEDRIYIEDVELDDDGSKFYCKIKNPAGSVTSDKAKLSVKKVSISNNKIILEYNPQMLSVLSNPVGTNEKVTFKFNNNNIISGELCIYDPLGNKIYAKDIYNQRGNIICDLKSGRDQDLGNGSYMAILKCTTQDGMAKIYKVVFGVKK